MGQFAGTGGDSGTGGDNVVDEKEMFIANLFWMDEAEGIVDVMQALPGMLASLALLEADTLHYIIIYRELRYLADATCHLIALVVTAFPLPSPRDRHWNDGVDAFEESSSGKLSRRDGTHTLGHFRLMVILHVKNELTDGSLWLVEEQGSSTLHGKLSPEESRHGVVKGLLLIVRQRQVQMAGAADYPLVSRQPLAADDAGAWRNDVKEFSPETRPHRLRQYIV